MRISKCSDKTEVAKPRLLTWDEMREEEGVYAVYWDSAYAVAKMIVLKAKVSKEKEATVVLYYTDNTTDNTLEPATGWENLNYRYTKLENASICFEIKENE